MVMFCFAIIAGFGLKTILLKFPKFSPKKIFMCSLLSLIILFEYASVIPVQSVVPTPDFYYNITSDSNYPILEIPICLIGAPNYPETMIRYYEYQKVHHGKMFGGYWSRSTPMYQDFLQSDPIISRINSGSEDIVNSSIEDPLDYLNQRYGVKNVVIHKKFLENESFNLLRDYLGNSYYLDTSISTDPLVIYSLNRTHRHSNFMDYNIISLNVKSGGWYNIEDCGGIPGRWMNGSAALRIDESSNQSVSLLLTARSFKTPRTLEIYSGDQFVSKVSIPTYFIPVNVTVPLKYGENEIRLSVPEGCERPTDYPEMNSTDSRCLSLSIQNITLM
jgi:hypothetical protein